jgi:hypothetical protein
MRVYGKQFAWLSDSGSTKTGEMGLPIQRLAEWYDMACLVCLIIKKNHEYLRTAIFEGA